MPADPDEDRLPYSPPRPARPAGGQAAGVPVEPPGGLAWGSVGFLHEAAELAAQPGTRGVVRYVNADVRYAAPPLPGGWRAAPGQPGRYEMPWPGDPGRARTLYHLRTDIERDAAAGTLRSGASPRLTELDAVAGGLLDAADRLHAAGWTLGLFQPDNVLWNPHVAGHDAQLVDLGFTWTGSVGPPPWDASPGRPAWLTPRAGWLSGVPAVRRQFADPAAAYFDPVPPVEDVRTLARLFAWLLTGQPRADVTAPSRSNAPALWKLLAAAASGRVPTADAFRQKLAAEPLSAHFTDPIVLAPPVRPPAPTGSVVKILAGLLFVAALGVGGALYAFWPRPAVTAGGPPATTPTATGETPEPTPPPARPPASPETLKQAMDELQAALAAKDLPAADAKLKALYALDPLSAADAAARQAKRGEFVNLCVAEYKAILTLAGQPAQKVEAARRAKALEDVLKSLSAAHPLPPSAADALEKETQCLDFASRLARQLGSPPS
ncbi:hypothetical protein [Fimbriiglobus ruber]|uniref:Protein kinase domain-containing protein n=1 Tax=Fimbriiglobus ruber TaxID=1908690 RepID=A0A225D4D5_9BACT|nr:hypothetical protein [Fimbriiglobus ruber]OWK36461.1 hypothetical protein FRUB_09024 [Fimbriiglobus ruber]